MKSRRNKYLLSFCLMALSPVVATAQDSARLARHEFSVQQVIDYAKKNNVQVKNALLDVQKQEQVNREVTSNAYPHINGSLGTSYNPSVATQVLPNFIAAATYGVLTNEGVVNGSGQPIQAPNDFGFIAAQFGSKFSATAGVSLSQILFDGQVFVGLQARDATIRFAQKNVEVTEELIKANIYKIYYQLVVSKTQVELLDANLQRIDKLLHDTREIYKAGFAQQLDVDRVNVALTNLQSERTRVLNTISNGYFGLKVLIGMPVADELILTDTLNEADIRQGLLENGGYSYEDRKEFQSAMIGKELNQYNIKRYKLSQLPTVTLTGNYAKNAQRNHWDFFGRGDWFDIATVNLNIGIPIFNGFFTKSKIAQAKIELQKTENLLNNMKLTIDNEVASARNNFNTAVATLEYQRKNMELAEKVYEQTKKKYEMGTGSQTEINTAQTDLKAAQTNYITALYDAIVARIDYLKATGKL